MVSNFSLKTVIGSKVRQPVIEQDQLSPFHLDPIFVVRQRRRGDDRHAIVLVRLCREIDAVIAIQQMRRPERRLAHQIVQTVPRLRPFPRARPAVRELAARTDPEEKVEDGGPLVLRVEIHDFVAERLQRRVYDREGRQGVEPRPQRIQDGAEHRLAVRGTDRVAVSLSFVVRADAPAYPWQLDVGTVRAGRGRSVLRAVEAGHVAVVRKAERDAPHFS